MPLPSYSNESLTASGEHKRIMLRAFTPALLFFLSFVNVKQHQQARSRDSSGSPACGLCFQGQRQPVGSSVLSICQLLDLLHSLPPQHAGKRGRHVKAKAGGIRGIRCPSSTHGHAAQTRPRSPAEIFIKGGPGLRTRHPGNTLQTAGHPHAHCGARGVP